MPDSPAALAACDALEAEREEIRNERNSYKRERDHIRKQRDKWAADYARCAKKLEAAEVEREQRQQAFDADLADAYRRGYTDAGD